MLKNFYIFHRIQKNTNLIHILFIYAEKHGKKWEKIDIMQWEKIYINLKKGLP